ncbi:hypothetical protein [Streptomyces sp. ok210]|uniref:hypothetical protein n=1 Tax=Streptomyces sp. ok210 TaxID=1761905 RepID=UPI0008EB7C2A|nr:hypothetical protein [Streptomyces sp. ok210]SFT29942.1 hypothetical protein SAMN04487982_11555 [Streptomyces sp. ok210]
MSDNQYLPSAVPSVSVTSGASRRLAERTTGLLGLDQPTRLWSRPTHRGLPDLEPCGDGLVIFRGEVVELVTGTTLWSLPEEDAAGEEFLDAVFDNDYRAWQWYVSCAPRTRSWQGQAVVRTATSTGMSITGHEPRTGRDLWHVASTQLPIRDWMAWFSRYDSAVYNAGDYWADLDPPRDRRLWTIRQESFPSVVAFTDVGKTAGIVLVVDEEGGSLAAVDPASQEVVWNLEWPNTYVGADDRHVVVGEWRCPEPEATCACHPDCGDDDPTSRCMGVCFRPGYGSLRDCQQTPQADRRTWCAQCNLPYGDATSVKVLDRSTGTLLWKHEWPSSDAGVRADPYASEVTLPPFQGPRALVGHTVITWEGGTFSGRAVADGTLLWESDIVYEALVADYVDATPRQQIWTTWAVFSNDECKEPDLLVNALTGRVLTLPGTRRDGQNDCGRNLLVLGNFLLADNDGVVTCYRLPRG